jgi:hypothetical protein
VESGAENDVDVAAVAGLESAKRMCENGAMAGIGRILRRLATGRLFDVTRTSGRAAGQIAAVLLWALTMSQVLVVVHAYTHPPAQTSATCGICLLGARLAHVPDAPSEPLEPRTLCVRLATLTYAPYVRPVHRKPSSRAPPLFRSTSAAG